MYRFIPITSGLLAQITMAAIDGNNVIGLLIQLIIIGCVFGILYWLIGVCGLPAPVAKVATVILSIVVALWLINLLLQVGGGHGFIVWHT